MSSVPVSNLPQMVYETKEDAKREGIAVTVVGHVGDGTVLCHSSPCGVRNINKLTAFKGNFHAALIFRNEKEYSKVQELSKRVIKRALRMDGTCKSCTMFLKHEHKKRSPQIFLQLLRS